MPSVPIYEPGRYWGKVTRQQLGETSTGKSQFVLSFLVMGKVNPADPEGDLLGVPIQQERSVYRVITDNTMEYLLADLEALEMAVGSFGELDENNPHCCDIRGKELAFECEHEPNRTKTQDSQGNDIWVNAEGMHERWKIARNSGPNVKRLEVKQVKQLDAMFGRSLPKHGGKVVEPGEPLDAAKPPPKRGPAPKNTPVAEQGGPDDGIPF